MMKIYVWSRRCAFLVTAGTLFQASGCAVDTNLLAANLATSIAQNLVATLVFGAFNLVP